MPDLDDLIPEMPGAAGQEETRDAVLS
jgi:hypothetical protein